MKLVNFTEHDFLSTQLDASLSATGSFVDEGLDLSQRLAESMFVGPDLDPAARDVVTNTGTKVGQGC